MHTVKNGKVILSQILSVLNIEVFKHLRDKHGWYSRQWMPILSLTRTSQRGCLNNSSGKILMTSNSWGRRITAYHFFFILNTLWSGKIHILASQGTRNEAWSVAAEGKESGWLSFHTLWRQKCPSQRICVYDSAFYLDLESEFLSFSGNKD